MTRRRGAEPDTDTAPERNLPHSLDAERSVLGAIIINNAAYVEAVRLVQPADFFRDAHRRIFEAMMTLLERPGGAVDMLLLREEMIRRGDLEDAGGMIYLSRLVDGVPHSTNVRYYADIVRQKSRSRALIFALNKGIAAAYEQDLEIDVVLEDADRAIVQLRHGGHGNVKSLAARTSSLMADLEFRVANRGKLTGLDTGFKRINDTTNGWQRGDLIIFAARPSMGKTALLCNTTLAAAEFALEEGSTRRRRVALVFSMEMKARQLEYRYLSALSGIPAMRLSAGYMGPSGSDDWVALNRAIERMHNAGIYIDDTPALTVGDVRAECRRLQAEEGLDLVAIDYVQLMQGSLSRKNATRTEELSDISRRLKVLAGELDVPIILLSQLKRTGGGRPKLEDLRESGGLEQDADIVAMLHRKNHKEGGRTEFIIEKNRNGQTGTELLTLYKDIVRFEDCDDVVTPEDEAAAEAEERKAAKGKAIAKHRRKVTI